MAIAKYLFLVFLLSLTVASANGQIEVPINKQASTAFEAYLNANSRFHSDIKPYCIQPSEMDSIQKLLPLGKTYNTLSISNIYLQPIVDAGYAHSTQKSGNVAVGALSRFKIGKQLSGNIVVKAIAKKYPFYIAETIDSIGVMPHFGTYLKESDNIYLMSDICGSIRWKPINYATITVGNDRNFWGNGYRSLFLSDNTSAYPQLKTEFDIWKIKYIAMWASLSDIETNSISTNYQSKYGVFHYLSLNVCKWLNISFFESVIWQGEDSTGTRGFEFNYLNPVLFYRSTEYSVGSPDNAMMGAGIKIGITPNSFIYGQFMLDDFIFKELKAKKGWWGNKYGYQAGAKFFHLFTFKNLYAQLEYNKVLPYTYSHASSLKCYGSDYQPLAHPTGANFAEYIAVVSYAKNKFYIECKNIYTQSGQDNSYKSYGSDIYKSYNLRFGNYGNTFLQGVKTTTNLADLKIAYTLVPKWNMQVYASLRMYYRKQDVITEKHNFYLIGFETFIDNTND